MIKQTKIASAFLSLLALFSLTPVNQVHAAATIGLYLSPSSQTVTNGTAFAVRLMADVSNRSPGSITIKGKLNFPKNLINVTSISTAGSNFTMYASTSYDNAAGTITFNRSNYYPTDASTLVFTINFKAIAVGSASVSIDPSTRAQGDPLLFANGGTYISQAPTCPAGQIGTPPKCTTPTPAPAPKPSPQPAPSQTTPTPAPAPVSVPAPTPDLPAAETPASISAGEMSIKETTAKSSWTKSSIQWGVTASDITTTIRLGTSKKSLDLHPEPKKQDDGTYIANVEKLLPGTRYYYEISAAATNAPEQKATFTNSFVTRGYPTVLTLKKDNKPITGTKIIIGDEAYTSNKDGRVELELANKTYTGEIKNSDGTVKTVTFTVANKSIPTDGAAPAAQLFSFDVTPVAATQSTAGSVSMWVIIGTAIGLLSLLGASIAFLVYRRKKTETTVLPTAIIDDYTWSNAVQNNQVPSAPQAPTEDISPFVSNIELPADAVQVVEQQYVPEITTPLPGQTSESIAQEPYYEQLTEPVIPSPSVTPESSIITNTTPLEAQPTATQSEISENKDGAVPIDYSQTIDESDAPIEHEAESTYDPTTGELDIIHHENHGAIGSSRARVA